MLIKMHIVLLVNEAMVSQPYFKLGYPRFLICYGRSQPKCAMTTFFINMKFCVNVIVFKALKYRMLFSKEIQLSPEILKLKAGTKPEEKQPILLVS